MRPGRPLRVTGKMKKMKMNEKTGTDAKNVNESDGTHSKNNRKTLLNIGQVMAMQYSKEEDEEGFIRLRIFGKTAIDDIICQVTGYITQIKNKQKTGGSTTPSNSFLRGDKQC